MLIGADSRVDGGMERFYAPAQHLRHVSQLFDGGHGQIGLAQDGLGLARSDQIPAKPHQRGGKLGHASLVVHTE